MTRVAINNSLWIAGVALQLWLLRLMLTRGARQRWIARRMPLLTLLLGFYLVRAILLFALFGHVAPAKYAATVRGLSLADLLLQLLVAGEIATQLMRGWGGWTFRRAMLLLLLPCVAWGASSMARQMLPANAPIPPDRLQMFDAALMILLCGVALAWPAAALLRRVTLGLAFYGVFDLMTTAGRTIAAVHRDARAFAEWSYPLSGAWIVVVVYWMVVLKPEPERFSPGGGGRAAAGS
jgi:hypothetical protein